MKSLIAALLLTLPASSFAESMVLFVGRPSTKISEGGIERRVEKIKPEKAGSLECVITQVGADYFWTSRDNTPLTRVDSGAYMTFVAPNGSGHIRVIKAIGKPAAALMGDTEKEFDYVEHLLIGLKSVTYYGTKQKTRKD